MNVRSDIRLDLPTPSLTLDFAVINDHYHRFLEAYPGAEVFYAVKANANPDVIQYVVNHGGGLEIASLAELDLSLRAGARGDRIICSNPIKNPLFLQRMADAGVYAVVVDSTYEVEKVARFAPGMRVYVRLSVDNTGSVLPLAGKFGVDGATALDLFEMARDLGLTPIGLSFHVGSQCLNPGNWKNAIAACGSVWRQAEARGFDLHFLDLGGGFPAGHYHTSDIPTIESISDVVMPAIRAHIPIDADELMLILEPGRGLVGESGLLYTSVVGKALRGDQEWVYLDVGVFNGLMETYEGFPPVVRLLAADADQRPLRKYTLAGPTCDSCDVVAREIDLPELQIDDVLLFLDAGAYVSEYGVAFNGFPTPEIVRVNAEYITGLTPAQESETTEPALAIA